MMSRLLIAGWLGLAFVVTLLPAPVEAQRQTYQGERSTRQAQDRPGVFDYYTLVLSWSPTYCASRTSDKYEPQCDIKAPRPYAFVLHGLWPQHKRGYPERCWTKDRPWVPKTVIDEMLDVMPSPALVIHEYRKHGTCSGFDARGYYKLAREMYDSIRIPARYIDPDQALLVGPDELADEFVAANPGMRHDMLAIACHGAGNRLREVRICFSRDGQLRSCGANENQRKLCQAQRMYVPPVRRHSASQPVRIAPRAEQESPLPGPR